ncbi:hypothetical protein P1J78_04135 [Psychromarinibacter sp. C21-152]|uniref:Uncharacterized protein n=1 Tax=Psychromarinibacter sediminicola TaxID=3033385 RepID=A0AAE3NP66_9RHOB|nr:hypothetical protein [Psychromarinibacter sediminicola]MDF0599914.1 hypothetical protein [Psychromarinibacter sediminicola]
MEINPPPPARLQTDLLVPVNVLQAIQECPCIEDRSPDNFAGFVADLVGSGDSAVDGGLVDASCLRRIARKFFWSTSRTIFGASCTTIPRLPQFLALGKVKEDGARPKVQTRTDAAREAGPSRKLAPLENSLIGAGPTAFL